MRNVSFVEIEAYLKSHSDSRAAPTLSFGPLVDNVTVFANYTARALAGNFSKVVGKPCDCVYFPAKAMLTDSPACYSRNEQ